MENKLTQLEIKILNKVISEVKVWDNEFNIFNVADFYVHTVENINNNRVVKDCKVNIERFLINGKFAKVTTDLQRCYFIEPNGFDLWKSKTIELYENNKARREIENIVMQKTILNSEELDSELKKKTIVKTDQDIKIGKRTIKYFWIPIFISGLACVSSILLPLMIHYNDVNNIEDIKYKIKDLDLKTQSNKRESLNYTDSLYKMDLSRDTAKKK